MAGETRTAYGPAAFAGLIAASAMIYLATVGLVGTFAERPIVAGIGAEGAGVVTLGRLMLVGVPFITALVIGARGRAAGTALGGLARRCRGIVRRGRRCRVRRLPHPHHRRRLQRHLHPADPCARGVPRLRPGPGRRCGHLARPRHGERAAGRTAGAARCARPARDPGRDRHRHPHRAPGADHRADPRPARPRRHQRLPVRRGRADAGRRRPDRRRRGRLRLGDVEPIEPGPSAARGDVRRAPASAAVRGPRSSASSPSWPSRSSPPAS